MRKILLKSGKPPFEVIKPADVYYKDITGSNCGNLLFTHAAYKILSAPGVEIQTQPYMDTLNNADFISNHFDQYVVPLANAFRNTYTSNLERLTELIEKLTIPVTILGVGAQSTTNYDLSVLSSLDKPVSRFVKAVLDHGPSIGVRGELTYDYIKKLGFRDVEIIGCPSMYYWGPNLAVNKKTQHLSPNDPVTLSYSPYLKTLYDFTLRQYEHFTDIVYIPQNSQDLALLLWGPSPLKKRRKTMNLSYPYYRDNKALFFIDPTTWINYLSTRAFTFGTRIHGTICSLLAGTPAFLVAHDSRTLELARFYSIPYKLASAITEDDDPAQWHDSADYTMLIKSLPQKYSIFKDYLARHSLETIFDYPEEVVKYQQSINSVVFPPPITGVPVGIRRSAFIRLMQSWHYTMPMAYTYFNRLLGGSLGN